MKYQVRWLKLAAEELQNIREYLDREAPYQAQEVVRFIYDNAMTLTSFPNGRGQREPDWPEYRRLVVLKTYKVFYKVIESNKTVEICHTRHTSQGYFNPYED